MQRNVHSKIVVQFDLHCSDNISNKLSKEKTLVKETCLWLQNSLLRHWLIFSIQKMTKTTHIINFRTIEAKDSRAQTFVVFLSI